ncbi:MAG: PD-(D/E)XK nuclease family protein [Nodosilinea sp.]
MADPLANPLYPTALFTLTQGHLKRLELCPRQFQYTYLERLAVTSDPAMLERQRWGTQFHQVMQQRELGLPVAPLLAQDAALEAAVNGLLAAAPELFVAHPDGFRQSEHRRHLAFNGYGLTVIYDLLVMTPAQAQIIDWKTYLNPSSPAQLAQDWQTRLYLYVLVETTDLTPRQVSMDYWFVQPQGANPDDSPSPSARQSSPSHVPITYSAAQHRRTERDLRRLTNTLTALMTTSGDLPQVDEAQGHCQRCPFAVRCQRLSERYGVEPVQALPRIEEIVEVPL